MISTRVLQTLLVAGLMLAAAASPALAQSDSGGTAAAMVRGTGATDTAAGEIAKGIQAYRQGDYRAAKQLLAPHVDRPSAALNYARAGYQLGEFGDEDVALLQGLAEQKSGAAARMLGDVYRIGKYAPVDHDRAKAFYSLAIDLGDRRSLLRLAQLYDEAGDVPRAIDAYSHALADFPEKEWRYLYLVAASAQVAPADRIDAATRLDRLAATDIVAARAAFDLYRRHDVPGAGSDRALAAAEAAHSLGAQELGIYVSSMCTACSTDDIESYIQTSTNFDDPRRLATALGRLVKAGRSPRVIEILDGLPSDTAAAVGIPLVKRLGVVSNQTVTLAQLRLEEAGLYGGGVDGLLGHKTLAALKMSRKYVGQNLPLTSAELFGWVITNQIGDCGQAVSGSAPSECSP